MQGIEAASTPRQGAWAAVNSVSPKFEAEERTKYSQPPGYLYQNPAYQQSPGQNSNPPSLISPSNGDSTPSINSPYTQGQSFHPQNVNNYPSITQHSQALMGPPNPQMGAHGWTEDQNEQWMIEAEAISMSHGNFDNYVQDELTWDWQANPNRNFFGFLNGCPPSTTSTY